MPSMKAVSDLQVELIACVASIQFRATEPEPSLRHTARLPVTVPHLPDGLFIMRHGVHTWDQRKTSVRNSVYSDKRATGAWETLYMDYVNM